MGDENYFIFFLLDLIPPSLKYRTSKILWLKSGKNRISMPKNNIRRPDPTIPGKRILILLEESTMARENT